MKPHSTSNNVPRETLERLKRFVELLLRWNRTINLIAPADEASIWDRHVADALQLLPLLTPPPQRAIDLGSGGGFPGLVLSIATGLPFNLVESDQRKAAFLREAARLTGAPVKVHAKRAEDCGLPPAPLVTARALAPLPRLLELTAPLLLPGGQCVFLKGTSVEAELTAAEAQWHMRVERIPSRTFAAASILRISDLRRVT